MANDQESGYAEYLAWERDALNRLYYGLWILFMSGLVYSFRVSQVHSCLVLSMVVAFRLLAVVGTALNFLMQYNALGALSHGRAVMLFKERQEDDKMLEEQKKMKRADRIVDCCETPLQLTAAAFLLVALALSFLVYGPHLG